MDLKCPLRPHIKDLLLSEVPSRAKVPWVVCRSLKEWWDPSPLLVLSLPFFPWGEQFLCSTCVPQHVLLHCGTQSDCFLLKCSASQVLGVVIEKPTNTHAMIKECGSLDYFLTVLFPFILGLPVCDSVSLSELTYKVARFTVVLSQYKCSLTCSGAAYIPKYPS